MKHCPSLTALYVWLLLLSIPSLADPGPLDGVWQDERGNRVTIASEVVHATVMVESPHHSSRRYRARYVAYTSLLARDPGQVPLRVQMVGPNRIYVSAPYFNGYLHRR